MCCKVFCGNVVVNFSYRGYPGMLAASSHMFYLPEVGGGDGDVACREVFVNLAFILMHQGHQLDTSAVSKYQNPRPLPPPLSEGKSQVGCERTGRFPWGNSWETPTLPHVIRPEAPGMRQTSAANAP